MWRGRQREDASSTGCPYQTVPCFDTAVLPSCHRRSHPRHLHVRHRHLACPPFVPRASAAAMTNRKMGFHELCPCMHAALQAPRTTAIIATPLTASITQHSRHSTVDTPNVRRSALVLGDCGGCRAQLPKPFNKKRRRRRKRGRFVLRGSTSDAEEIHSPAPWRRQGETVCWRKLKPSPCHFVS